MTFDFLFAAALAAPPLFAAIAVAGLSRRMSAMEAGTMVVLFTAVVFNTYITWVLFPLDPSLLTRPTNLQQAIDVGLSLLAPDGLQWLGVLGAWLFFLAATASLLWRGKQVDD